MGMRVGLYLDRFQGPYPSPMVDLMAAAKIDPTDNFRRLVVFQQARPG